MKKLTCVLISVGLSLASLSSGAVTEKESEILQEVEVEIKYLIEKVMEAKSYQREDDQERIKFENILMDLKEVKIRIGLAANASRNHRKAKSLNLDYIEGY
ncbi:hypothetical protein [Pseudoalteromonas luteoviolacea]|uniref:Uncharacterized protein n=1 Tax=Pseudoalteromonas luteoviolacea S4060-1 TaxID=1365257 RepID=A0A167KW02_9GAMM|nr:hypothetical protein [Pseudoalteromonas luteoviolacea]KZN63377.1 hypothetical protein N478_03750 [Pseudoalteromonas luteoviolacea S4060-1]